MELHVSFSEILAYFKRNLVRFVLVIAGFGLLFGLAPLKFFHPQYSASTTVLISCALPEDAQTDYRLQYTGILNNRVEAAVAMASGQDMIDEAARKLNVDPALISSVSAVQINTSPLLKITADTSQADLAARISDTTADILSEKMTRAFPSPQLTVEISDPAVPVNVQSKRALMLKSGLLGLVFGFLLSVGIGIVAVLLDRTVRNSRFAAEALHTDFLAAVPRKEPEKKSASYRRLRAAILSRAKEKKRFLVADVCEQDGAAETALGLSASLAASGKRVLLVDADLHAPKIARLLSLNPRHTLADVLAGSAADPEEAEEMTGTDGLTVIAAAAQTAEKCPADLLASDAFSSLLDRLGPKFDFVIVCAPSESCYPDADNIVSRFDAVLPVAKYGSTPFAELKEAFRKLQTAGGTVVGFVTTNV